MPAPLLPLLAGAISRLVTANVGRSVAGAIGRATASRGAAAAAGRSAAPGNAKSALGYVARFARQQSSRRAARAKKAFVRNAPGFAQAHRWGNINKAFGQLQKARSNKAAALQIGDPLKVQQAEEQEDKAKQKLAKETKALLESFVGLRRGLIGLVIAIHSIPFAVQAIGRARVETIRPNSMFAGRTASALARYDVNERLNKISSARSTSASDSRLIEATQSLNNELKPLNDAIHVLTNEGILVLVKSTTSLISMLRVFSPMVRAIESLARYFSPDPTDPKTLTGEMMNEMVKRTVEQMKHAREEWDKQKLPAGGKLP